MNPSLTPKDQRIVTLAEKGIKSPLDASLFVLQEAGKIEDDLAKLRDEVDVKVGKLDTKIDDAIAQIEADAPDLNKVLESVRGQDGDVGEKGETGEQGEQGIQGEQGADGKDGVDGKDGRDGIDGIDGKDGEDGTPADETAIIEKIETDLPKLGERIRDGLELLQGDERLDISAVKGVDAVEARILAVESRRISPGRSLLQLYVGGAKKGAIQYLNLVAGTGVTLTHSAANGRNDITITASGGAALSVLTATGTVDGSNKTFTFASTPTLVIVNGAAYRNGHGCTIVTTTVTLDYPVGVGGDIYALG